MLKIKDNVDLKELEKFNFSENVNGFKNAYVKYLNNNSYEYNIIYVMKSDKAIRLGHYQDEYGATDTLTLDIFYDLIKADLVEKVEK